MKKKTLTYYVTRDSARGVLSTHCDLWWLKPRRVSQDGVVVWVPTGVDPGHLGAHPLSHVVGWFSTFPETDLEMIAVQQGEVPPKVEKTAKAKVRPR